MNYSNMTKYNLSMMIIVLGVCCSTGSADDNVNEIEAKIFDANRPPLPPSLTLQHLKHLGEKYFHTNTNDSIQAGKVIQGLIEAWQIEPANCNRETWNSLSLKIASYAGNAKRYLEFCRESYFIVCQEAQAKKMSQASLQLTDLEVDNVNLLKDTIIENDPRWWRDGSPLTLYLKDSQISPQAVQRGLLKFVELNSPLETCDRDQGYFDKVLDQLVEFPCDKVEIHISPKVDDLYRMFPELNDKKSDLVERLDQLTLNWIANTKVCSALKNNWEGLVSDTYEALKDKIREERERQAAWDRAQQQEELKKQQEFNRNSGIYGYVNSLINYIAEFLG